MSMRTLWLVSLLALASCDSCKKKPDATPSTSAPDASARTAWRTTLRAPGTTGAIFRALPALALNEEQQTKLSEIGAELQEGQQRARGDAGKERAELRAALADLMEQVKAGKIDSAKLQAREAALARSAEARHKHEAEALNRVQRVLDPSQRATVASGARASEERTRRANAGPDHRRDAGGDAGARRKELSWARMRLESYVDGLKLDAEQDKKIKAILDAEPLPSADAHEAEAEQRAALLDAFEKPGFDANHFPIESRSDGRTPFFGLARFLEKVVPILEPAQLLKLAEKLDEPETRMAPRKGRYYPTPPPEEDLE
jgi:Spy/CpxP family protein refolding chaperone